MHAAFSAFYQIQIPRARLRVLYIYQKKQIPKLQIAIYFNLPSFTGIDGKKIELFNVDSIETNGKNSCRCLLLCRD